VVRGASRCAAVRRVPPCAIHTCVARHAWHAFRAGHSCAGQCASDGRIRGLRQAPRASDRTHHRWPLPRRVRTAAPRTATHSPAQVSRHVCTIGALRCRHRTGCRRTPPVQTTPVPAAPAAPARRVPHRPRAPTRQCPWPRSCVRTRRSLGLEQRFEYRVEERVGAFRRARHVVHVGALPRYHLPLQMADPRAGVAGQAL
jgi:hypothetical protein